MNEISQLLKELIGETVVLPTYPAEVLEVDDEARTCKVRIIATDLERENVRLQAGDTKNGIYIKPAVNSVVLVTLINQATAFVSLMSDVDQVIIIGELDEGVPVASVIAERLNAIEKAFNDLLNDYKGHNHAHPQGPTTAFIVPPTLQQLQETDAKDLQNDKIRQ